MVKKLAESPAFKEFQSNRRLQWMILAIVAILILSLGKRFSDSVADKESELNQQKALYSRILSAANQPIDEDTVATIDRQYQTLLSAIPIASSDSVAQAEALKRMERIIRGKMAKQRVNLVAVDTITTEQQTLWQVRIDVAGQLAQTDLIHLLSQISGEHPDVRLLSMQYNPKLSNSMSFVVDFLFKGES